MRAGLAFLAAALLGALVVARAGDDEEEAAIRREVASLTAKLDARIERAKKAQRAQQMERRIYDVAAFPTEVERQLLTPSNLEAAAAGTELVREETEPRWEVDALVEVLRVTCEPESWETLEGAEIRIANDRMFVNTLPRVHEAVGKTLKLAHVAVATRFAVEVFAVPVAPREAAELGKRAREIADAQAERLLSAAGAERVSVICLDGQQRVQRSGRELVYAAGSQGQMTVLDGLGVEVRPLAAGTAGALLQYRVEKTRLAVDRRASDEKEALDLPELDVTRANGALWIPYDKVVVLGGSTTGKDPLVFLARVRVAK